MKKIIFITFFIFSAPEAKTEAYHDYVKRRRKPLIAVIQGDLLILSPFYLGGLSASSL